MDTFHNSCLGLIRLEAMANALSGYAGARELPISSGEWYLPNVLHTHIVEAGLHQFVLGSPRHFTGSTTTFQQQASSRE